MKLDRKTVNTDVGRDMLVRLPTEGLNLAQVEVDLLHQALIATRGNRSRAGLLLGMNRDQVRYRVRCLGLGQIDYERLGG